MNHKIQISFNSMVLSLSFISLIIVFQIADFSSLGYIKDIEMLKNTITRGFIGIFLMILMVKIGYKKMFSFRNVGSSLMIMLPALLISINNFPIIAYLNGRAYLTEPNYRVLLFFIECLSVGFFEEIIFRGILLSFLMQKFIDMKNGIWMSIIISSLIFGIFHMINVFTGASMSITIVQMGYSFLMGMLWAVMYLRTGNLWLTMLLHATYNFFGQVMFYLGTVQGRFDIVTVWMTVIVAVFTAIYALKIVIKDLSTKVILKY